MAFLNTPRFFKWVLVSTLLFVIFVTSGGQPNGSRRQSWFLCSFNLPYNVLQLGEVADFEAPTFNLALMFI
jgi:hypothetical protein